MRSERPTDGLLAAALALHDRQARGAWIEVACAGPLSMSLLGNIIWFLFGGLIAFVGYVLAGILLCLTIVGIPFGVQAIKLGVAASAPFGKEVVELPDANSPLRVLFNVLWIVLFGWELVVSHLVLAAILAITVIGIPFALQHVKMVPLALLPFGRDLV